jgi:hypothetical protein
MMHLNSIRMKQSNLSSTAAIAFLCLIISSVPLPGAGGSGATNHVPQDYPGKPLTGTPQTIPGLIQAESYDVTSGEAKGVTVNYEGELRKSKYRPGADSAGLGRFGSGHVSIDGKAEGEDQIYVGWTKTGQWMAYTVQVKETGTYVFGGKFASAGKSIVSVTFAPGLTTGAVEIPSTAGRQPAVEVYHVWETLDHLKEISLPAGVYLMKVKIEANAGLNMDYFTFTKKG